MSADAGSWDPGSTQLPPRSRGVIALVPQLCTSCMVCVRGCPNWCIHLDAHSETVPPATPRGRARTDNVLDRFAIDFGLCMYCGICVEVCPFDALHWSGEHRYAATQPEGLVHERDRLASFLPAAPSLPALDPAAPGLEAGNPSLARHR